MWTYEQSTGVILHDDEYVGVGYSGHAEGKDNPELQDVKDIGPIPVGVYKIGPPYDSGKLGPHVMSLTPLTGVETFGRNGFFWHGDDKRQPGAGSHGCIVSSRAIRDQVSDGLKQGDDLIEVVRGTPGVSST